LCHSIANGNALDITEIDAASNTGVDNIRELIERAQFAPVKARFKVYIIDECLTGDTLVQTDTGLMRIDNQDLLGKQVLSYNESLSTWEYKKVLRWLDRDVKPTLIIKTNQRSIQCTGNHLIRTESGWISASNVTIGMNILSPEPVDVEKGSKSLNSCFTKVDDYRVSCPTGSDIPTKKITASGNVVKKITLNLQDQSLLKYCDSFTGHYWEILPLPSQISTVASQELLGHEELKPITMFAWAQMPVESDYQSYRDILLPQWATNLERVESITVVGDEPVYDIEVEDNHNFVANGLLVHNCHMLSTAAFNALLKTLEEPPDRVTFILATTDPQRVLPTIISRCQRFDFRRIPLESMVKHLGKIATNENININTEALTLVAQIAQGGLRDAESLLDQLSLLDGEITVEAVWDLVGSVAEQDLLSLIEAIANDHSTQLIDYVRRIMDRGREPLIVLQNLANMYRDLLIAKTASDRSDLVAMTSSGWERLVQLAQTLPTPNILLGQQHLRSAELQIRNSTQPRLWLEVTLMGLLPSAQGGQSSNTFPAQATHPRNISATPLTISQSPKPNPIPQSSPVPKQELLTSVPDLISHSSIEQPVTKTSSELSIPISISLLNTQSPILSQNDDLNSFASVGYDLNQLWQNLLLMLPSPTRAIFVQMEACFLEVDTNSVKIGLGGKRDETTKNIAIQKRLEL
ncbi:MAG: DNA polymerase III subunit gamma/tau, partial [Pseudanabaena sp.]